MSSLVAGCGGAGPEEPGATPQSAPAGALFSDWTEAAGIEFEHATGALGNRELPETMGAGVGLLDHDADGDLDIYLVQSGPLPSSNEPRTDARASNALFANDGSGRFTRIPGAAGADDRGYGQGCAVGDANGDGWDDLAVLNLGSNALYFGSEAGFRASSTGLEGDGRWSVSAAFVDVDGDGDLDLYEVNYLTSPPDAHADASINPYAPAGFPAYPHPDRFRAQPDRLLRNTGDGRFEDMTDEAGVAVPPGKGLGLVPTDLELDGWVDLYVANDSTPNFLFHNLAGKGFEEVGRQTYSAFNDDGRTEAGMGVDGGDVDGDGDLDLFVTNLDLETNTLYLNRASEGRQGYRDRTRRAGLSEPSRNFVGFGALLFDADRDAQLDLFVANGHIIDNVEEISDTRVHAQRDQLFLGDGQGTFREGDESLFPPELRIPSVARGSALGDLDGDGAADLVISSNGGRPRVLRGTPPARPHLTLSLRGPPGNPRGLGALIRLDLEGGARITARLESARSYASASGTSLHLGLPSPVAQIEVCWPGGLRERWHELPAPLPRTWTLSHGSGVVPTETR